ncbi:geranylgeranylglycerol-phosphate geranylgeranyltransferase [Flavobacterium humi]|uniref:Prenyltransferase n=1 Tax=Flavobacterium humi TaxID=2562683 RepID=A0A4Z0LA13_9FLAO|nr:geranylgeranylglycerol-phosphate geranylgeranyltransferase [Flavobacterium humi]TGD58049.1 prenyltransferase [Flavobacterium humi]
MKYLNLIRYKNLIMIALMQLIVLYGFLNLQYIELFLEDWQFLLLVLATVSIAAGGYIINNIIDQGTDLENKPQDVVIGKAIPESLAYNLYFLCTVTGVGIGFYLSNAINKPGFVTAFILVAAMLYIYATNFKQIIIIKNIIVALLLSFSILIVGLFEIFPATHPGNQVRMSAAFSILFDFATIAFIINFIREIVKDIEDVNGDYNSGIQTLPIAFGVSRTSKLVFGLSFIPVLCILYYIYNYLFQLQYAMFYLLGFVIGPLLYFTIKIWSAKSKEEFHHLSRVLKLVIFFGIIAIGVIGLNIKYYAA